jgi:hypothetical protein
VTAPPVAVTATTATGADVAEGKAVLDMSDQAGGDSSSEQQPDQKTDDHAVKETAAVENDTLIKPSETGEFVSSHAIVKCQLHAWCNQRY